MPTTVYNIAQITEPKTSQIVLGISGYTLSDTPTKIGYGLPSLPTPEGYLSKRDSEYDRYNANKTTLSEYIIGSIVLPKHKNFYAKAIALLSLLKFSKDDTVISIIAEVNSFENVFKNYTERSVEFLDKVRKGIELGHEIYEGVNVADVEVLISEFTSAIKDKSITFYVRKPYEEKSNYGIKLAQLVLDWSINCCKEIPLERLDYLPQEERLDLPTIISDYPRAYFNSKMESLNTEANSYYLTRISTDEENLLGCRINDVSYCYLETKEPLEVLDKNIALYRDNHHFTELHISRIDINALKSKGQRYFTERGLYRPKDNRKGPAPMGHMHGLVMLDPFDQIVINDIVPTGLSMMIADHFKELIELKNRTHSSQPDGLMLEVISLRDHFFDAEVKKDKIKYKLKKEFSVGSKSTPIVVYSNHLKREIKFPLFFGYDCYSRNALARLADELIDFSIVLYERSSGNYRYATLLETDSLVAVVATCHANKLYIL